MKLFLKSVVFIFTFRPIINPLTTFNMTKRKYFSEAHRKYSEACQKEVEEMSKHPLSHEQFEEQMRRNREESLRRAEHI